MAYALNISLSESERKEAADMTACRWRLAIARQRLCSVGLLTIAVAVERGEGGDAPSGPPPSHISSGSGQSDGHLSLQRQTYVHHIPTQTSSTLKTGKEIGRQVLSVAVMSKRYSSVRGSGLYRRAGPQTCKTHNTWHAQKNWENAKTRFRPMRAERLGH